MYLLQRRIIFDKGTLRAWVKNSSLGTKDVCFEGVNC